MAIYPWARAHFGASVPVDGLDNLNSWFERLDERPAIQRALEKPKPIRAFFDRGDVEIAEAANAVRFITDQAARVLVVAPHIMIGVG